MREFHRKEVAYERVLFFCDAVVAIAITLLALNLKITVADDQHLTFSDLIAPWHQYIAFLLSFFTIALFWRTHHDFFVYIRKNEQRFNDAQHLVAALYSVATIFNIFIE